MGSPAENISSSKVNIARQASVRVTKQGRDGSAGGHQQEPRVDQPGRPVLVPGANPDEVKGQVAVKNWARGLAPRTHFLCPCRENSHAHLGATAHRRRPALSPVRLFSPELGRSPVLRLETPNPKPTEPAAQQAARSLPERQPPSPGPLARQPGMTSARLGEGRTAQECRRGLGRWPPRELASAPVVSFFSPPKSQLARSLSLGDFMCQTAYPPQAAPCRNAGECEPECAHVGACAWEARLPRGGGGAAAARASRASGGV